MANNSVTIDVRLNEGGVTKGVKTIKGGVDNLAASVGKLDGGFTVLKGTLANLATGAVSSLASAFADVVGSVMETGQTFESSMSKVAALSGATGEELQALTDVARQYGATTTFSASEAADALGYMALAGWDAEQSTAALPGVLDLAAASGMGLAEASDMVTDYLSAFGMEASDATSFADMLAYSQANSNTSAEQLGEAYKNCAANLNAAGQDVQTVTSLLAMMANQGLKGSEAGTALSAIMRDITAKMEDGAIAIGDTSVAVTDADGNFRDLTDILKDVEAATDGMGDAERSAALSATFTADSTKGLNLLLNAGVISAEEFEAALRDCDGAAGEMAATMNDNLEGDLKQLNSALEELQLKAYDAVAPALRGLAQTATGDLIPAISDLVFGVDSTEVEFDEFGTRISETTTHTDGLVDKLAAFGDSIQPGIEAGKGYIEELSTAAGPLFEAVGTAADTAGTAISDNLGPVLEDAQGAFETLGGKVQDAVGTISENFGGAITALTPVIEPAVELVSGALSGAFETAATVGGTLADAAGNLSGVFTSLSTEVGPGLTAFFDGFDLSAVQTTVENLAAAFSGNLNSVIETAENTIIPALGTAFDTVADHLPEIQAVFDSVINAIGLVINTVFTTAATLVSTKMTMISDVINIVTAAINGDWEGVWQGISDFFSNIWSGIRSVLDTFTGGLSAALDGFLDGTKGVWEEAWQGVCDFASTTWDAISTNVGTTADTIRSGIDGFLSGVKSNWDTQWGNVKSKAAEIWSSVSTTIGTTAGSIQGGLSNFVGTVRGYFEAWGLGDVVGPIFDEVQKLIEDPIGAARDFVQGIPGEIIGFFSGLGSSITNAIGSIHFPTPHVTWEALTVFGYDTPINLPHVSWYATGGIATGPSVVGIGEAGDEAIVPLQGERMRPFAEAIAEEMERAGRGGDINITINVAKVEVPEGTDVSTLAERVSREIAERVRRELARKGVTA